MNECLSWKRVEFELKVYVCILNEWADCFGYICRLCESRLKVSLSLSLSLFPPSPLYIHMHTHISFSYITYFRLNLNYYIWLLKNTKLSHTELVKTPHCQGVGARAHADP